MALRVMVFWDVMLGYWFLMFSEMSGTSYLMKQHHTPQDLNSQSCGSQHRPFTHGV
jgi:hypothetical protein